MTKSELANKIAAETGMTQADVLKVIRHAFAFISDELVAGRKSEFRDFGVFEVRKLAGRKCKCPTTGETAMNLPPRVVVRFRAGKELKAAVDAANH